MVERLRLYSMGESYDAGSLLFAKTAYTPPSALSPPLPVATSESHRSPSDSGRRLARKL